MPIEDESFGGPLSGRELEVMLLLWRGRIEKEAAADLGISQATVRTYRNRAVRKLGHRGLVQSALVAWRLGQLDMEALAEEAMAERSVVRPVP